MGSGPKYANGNYKSQQKTYNKTPNICQHTMPSVALLSTLAIQMNAFLEIPGNTNLVPSTHVY